MRKTNIIDVIARKLGRCNDLHDVGLRINSICMHSVEIGQNVLEHLDKEKLVAKLSQAESLVGAAMCICRIRASVPDIAEELCGSLNLAQLASTLKKTKDSVVLKDYLNIIQTVDKQAYKKLLELLDG
jgi:hypothetical protein